MLFCIRAFWFLGMLYGGGMTFLDFGQSAAEWSSNQLPLAVLMWMASFLAFIPAR